MKRYLLCSFAAAAALALSAGAASARTFGLIPHRFGHCNRCGTCVAQPNAFTPVCVSYCCPGQNDYAGGGWGMVGCDGQGSAPSTGTAMLPFNGGAPDQGALVNGMPPQPPMPPNVYPPRGPMGYGYPPQAMAYGSMPLAPPGYGYPPQMMAGWPQGPAPGMQPLPWGGMAQYNPYNLATLNRGFNPGYTGMMPGAPQANGNAGGR
jgi:hypothetical protein